MFVWVFVSLSPPNTGGHDYPLWDFLNFISRQAHTFTFILYKGYDTSGKHYNICLYPWSPLNKTTLDR